MKNIYNERGIALVTALMLTALCLIICLSLLYIITQAVKTTGSQKRYSNSVAASYGGVELIKDVMPRLMGYSTARSAIPNITGFGAVGLTFPSATNDLDCLDQKLKNATNDWSSACTSDNKSNIARVKPDFTMNLPGLSAGNGFKVAAKIVNTVKGNSDQSGVDYLEVGLGVSQAGGGVIAPQHLPAMYTIEVSGEQETKAKERAELSVLYAY